MGRVSSASKNFEQQWPKPRPFDDKLPSVDAFDEDLLPDCLKHLILDIAERMQVPPDYPAATIVVALGGAISRRACIQPKARDTGWIEIPNLWGGIIAEPGALKSPTLSAVMKPVEEVQANWHKQFARGDGEIQRVGQNRTERSREATSPETHSQRFDVRDAARTTQPQSAWIARCPRRTRGFACLHGA